MKIEMGESLIYSWLRHEKLCQLVQTVRVDSVEFKCEPLAYPPLLTIKAQGSCLRILLDFNHYYDSEDLASLATEAKNDGYSLPKYFLYYILSSPFAYYQFCDSVSGAVVKNLNSDKVSNALFPLPPLNEQRRIVQRIEELFPLVKGL